MKTVTVPLIKKEIILGAQLLWKKKPIKYNVVVVLVYRFSIVTEQGRLFVKWDDVFGYYKTDVVHIVSSC